MGNPMKKGEEKKWKEEMQKWKGSNQTGCIEEEAVVSKDRRFR